MHICLYLSWLLKMTVRCQRQGFIALSEPSKRRDPASSGDDVPHDEVSSVDTSDSLNVSVHHVDSPEATARMRRAFQLIMSSLSEREKET